MKLAKVIPIYKAKSKESLNNYRPISLLSNISKILEKVMHKRLCSFMNKHHLLCESQYGFRSKHSTVDAITEFVTKILPSLDKREICLSAYLDLSKAFDTINHDVMLKKLHYYGIRGNALAWFNSYLSHRRQYVCYKGVSSEVQEADYGVPQGSVLGPLLFIIYANDIPHSITHGTTIMFADDTTVLVKGTDMQSAYDHMNVALNGLSDWYKANQLSANPTKTKYIHFGCRNIVVPAHLRLSMDGELLERVPSTKFLGLFIDEQLTWEYHIKHCQKKVSQGIYALNMSKHILMRKSLMTLYYALVQPYLQFGLLLWGHAYKKHFNRLEVAQRKAIRAITGAKYNESASQLFKTIGVLKLSDMLQVSMLQYMYRFVNDDLPAPLLETFVYHRDVHTHATRHQNDPKPPKANSDLLARSFICKAPIIWMNLDQSIRNANSKSTFKRIIKKSMISHY